MTEQDGENVTDAEAPGGDARTNRGPKPVLPGPPRHLIDEYTHKSQVVRCECGWMGSSASPDGRPSEWRRHVAEFKGVKL